MALTDQQQTSILQLTQALFNITPGAVILKALGDQMAAGKSLAELAQSLSASKIFFGKRYDDVSFADDFTGDLLREHVSAENKFRVITYINDKIAVGASQEQLIAELTQALSVIPASDPDWGDAAVHYNTGIATKVVSRLVGDTITASDRAFAVDYILTQMAAGQTFGTMVEWAITALHGIDHSDPVWGNAVALFDNRIEVSKYYSVEKAGSAIDSVAA